MRCNFVILIYSYSFGAIFDNAFRLDSLTIDFLSGCANSPTARVRRGCARIQVKAVNIMTGSKEVHIAVGCR